MDRNNYNFVLKCKYNNSFENDALQEFFKRIKTLFDGFNSFALRQLNKKQSLFPLITFDFEDEDNSIKIKFNCGYTETQSNLFKKLLEKEYKTINDIREQLEQEKELLKREWKDLESVKEIFDPKRENSFDENLEESIENDLRKKYMDEEEYNNWYKEHCEQNKTIYPFK